MCINESFKLKRALLLTLITLSIFVAKGEERTVNSRYFIIESNEIAPVNQGQVGWSGDPQYKPEPLFAIKSNLLFDALSLVNFEVEVPIKKNISIAAEWIFPWWTMDNGKADSKRNRLQLLNGNLEVRYWFQNSTIQHPLIGWFAGVYTGAGSYDLEYHTKGYQGEFFVAAGVSGGYAHTVNKRGTLRMEYSLGIGYLATDYHYYEAEFCTNNVWHAIVQRKGRYNWFGPTRAKVSLSLLINKKLYR